MSGTGSTYWNHNAAFHDELVADAARRGGRALDVGCGEGLRALAGFVAPGGRLCVVGLAADKGPGDRVLSALSVLPNWVASRWHREARDIGVPVAPPRESLREIRAAAARVLPGCRLRRRMYWRYRLTWDRPGTT